jgi:hypothetical protein
MNEARKREILELLDWERQNLVFPGTRKISEMGLTRYLSDDGTSAFILFSRCPEADLDRVVRPQTEKARRERYELEWKWYAHDLPASLPERLSAGGFEPGEREACLVLSADAGTLESFNPPRFEIRQIVTREALADVQLISEEVYGTSFENRIRQWASLLEKDPKSMSIYVAYLEGEPAASGRVDFVQGSKLNLPASMAAKPANAFAGAACFPSWSPSGFERPWLGASRISASMPCPPPNRF